MSGFKTLHTIKINLPQIVRVDDYHTIDEYRRLLRELTGEKVHSYELGFDQKYVGVLYIGSLDEACKTEQVAQAMTLIDDWNS